MILENIIQRIDTLLKEAHFETFYFEEPTKRIKFCFDILVKKDNSIFLVKVFPNIDNLNDSIVENIKLLSVLLNSKPLLIGIKNRYQNLEDNTIYIREELPFITLKTLENVLKEQKYPHILARRGGGIIFLDGNLMKSIRVEKNLSRKEISDQLGVTKRTLCSYENETMRPSQKIAEKILEILDDKSIFRKINVFEWQIKVNFIQDQSSKSRELTDFESHLQDIFKDIGVSTIWYKRGQLPFELSISSNNYVLNADDEFYPVLSGLSEETTKVSKLNLQHLKSFAEIFHKNAFFIVNNDFKISDKKSGVPVIKLKDLEKMDTEKDFVDLFEEN
ncbi:MAG: helix-turn-helix domain-containing protein [Promethearchaeota archaeon]